MAMMQKGPVRMQKRAAMAMPTTMRQPMPMPPKVGGAMGMGGMKKGGKVKGKPKGKC